MKIAFPFYFEILVLESEGKVEKNPKNQNYSWTYVNLGNQKESIDNANKLKTDTKARCDSSALTWADHPHAMPH